MSRQTKTNGTKEEYEQTNNFFFLLLLSLFLTSKHWGIVNISFEALCIHWGVHNYANVYTILMPDGPTSCYPWDTAQQALLASSTSLHLKRLHKL